MAGRGTGRVREEGPVGFRQRFINRDDTSSDPDMEETTSQPSFTSILTTECGSSDGLTRSGTSSSISLTSMFRGLGPEDEFSDGVSAGAAMESDQESHLESVYFTDEWYSDYEEMEEEAIGRGPDWGIPDSDFLLPEQVKIPSLGHKITENDVATCLVGEVRSPSEFYLTLAMNFPEDMDDFVAFMSDTYHAWARCHRRHTWMLSGKERFLQPGATVACFNPTKNSREANEIVRARIIREVTGIQKRKRYDVFLMDLAQHHAQVPSYEMFFLYEQFAKVPSWGIKCRLRLEPHYERFHEGTEEWPTLTNRYMMNVLRERTLKVRFLRRITQKDGEPIWEVSILELDPGHDHIKEGKPVEQQIIRKTMGAYEKAKGKK